MVSRTTTYSVGIIGARGYVGREFVKLLDAHPSFELTLAASSSNQTASIRDLLGVGPDSLEFTPTDPEAIAHDCPDILVLALPNGHAESLLHSIEAVGAAPEIVIDLSADMRFNTGWTYCIPELHGHQFSEPKRISNPGCYATAVQLTLAPLLPQLASTPHCFGVSGYSGAGSVPNPRNDTSLLEGGITPYALAGHLHELEASHHLSKQIRFAPSVAPFFRGIVLTALCTLSNKTTAEELATRFESAYTDHPLVSCIGAEMPRVQDIVDTPHAIIGGITTDPALPTHAAVVCVIDNLLKGAASQAIQNLNLALGLDPLSGLNT